MVVLQHKHSLFLIDLNPKYPHDEQVYDDEEDLMIKQAFQCLCARCEQEITYLHRQRQILTECDACGKEHKGVFYECITCFHFLIHKDCVFQPKRLLIQDGTYGRFSHTHPLVLTYSFPIVDQKAKFYPTCRVCDNAFSENENLWVYKCDKCRYYAHTDCANAIHKPSSSNSESNEDPGDVLTFEEYKEIKDFYRVLDLPLPDLSKNRFTALFSKESNEMSITHNCHQHPLILVDSRCNDVTKVEDLCNGCDSQITTVPFYKCANGCNFVLHEWCSRLPTELIGHPSRDSGGYDEDLHAVVLKPKAMHDSEAFVPRHNRLRAPHCLVCYNNYNGFAYHCADAYCYYHIIDVWCALIPRVITHKSHPYHLFFKVLKRLDKDYCRLCLSGFTNPEETSFSCSLCNFHLHPKCALLLPETTRHKYDKHPMTLSYRPVENHIGDYFCEVCEEEMNPNVAFYHCHECAQSMHTTCAPLVPLSKPHIHDLHLKGSHETDHNWKKFFIRLNKEIKNLFQIPSSSMVPRSSSTSS
ncbi:putative chromatin regulator PHD family [Helianthus annuus]|nr:putative chromatin regulator PHD family [Helianthus annuus]